MEPENLETRTAMDFDEETVHGMTASYTEISFNIQSSEQDDSLLEDNSGSSRETAATEDAMRTEDTAERPNKLPLNDDNSQQSSSKSSSTNRAVEFLNQLNGTVTQDGEMVLFVAEDLENKIKLSSPVSKSEETAMWSSGMPWLYRQTLSSNVPAVDSSILTNLETEIGKIATSIDSLIENLAGISHSMSALTVECLEAYRDVVCKTCDAIDLNIKYMYQLMAKCEELSKSMKPIYKLAEHIKEMKHFLEIFENTMN
uniref:BLOC-1-related complex subunit 6 C-terminal helix domain-containing protein n=1 Tax=Graphocephala atropunctata TaxID=36148 RepID=A0A1B6L3N0_9HEMI